MGKARIARYLNDSNGTNEGAMQLYHWNSLTSQALYFPLQVWEVCLRNRINKFLIKKYNAKWPYDQRALRNLKKEDFRRLRQVKARQERERNAHQAPTDSIVADLSAGFWVSQLSKAYEVPYTWHYNLQRVFPYEQKMGRQEAHDICDKLLILRNRVAHHEPIYSLDLKTRRQELERMIKAMCPGSQAYLHWGCTFETVLQQRP